MKKRWGWMNYGEEMGVDELWGRDGVDEMGVDKL